MSRIEIRRLGETDGAILELLAQRDAEFDIPGRGEPRTALSIEASARYLSNPDVLFWAAFDGADVTGFLSCLIVPKRSQPDRELLLYEIGVHRAHRLRGVGRQLIDEMERWMRNESIEEVWVLSDNSGADAFYISRGFKTEQSQPKYLTRRLTGYSGS